MFNYLSLLHTAQEKEFFMAVYKKYRHNMYFTAYDRLKNKQDAEDVVQMVFLKLINNIETAMSIKEDYKLWNYISTIIYSKCTALQKNNAKDPIDNLEILDSYNMEEALESLDICGRIKKIILNKMNSPFREVLILKIYHEMNAVEIAKMMDKTPDNIRHIVQKAKKKLSVILEEGEI